MSSTGVGSKRRREDAASSRRQHKIARVEGAPRLSAADLDSDDVKLVLIRAPPEFDWALLDGQTVAEGFTGAGSRRLRSGARLQTADRSDAVQLRVMNPVDPDDAEDSDGSEEEAEGTDAGKVGVRCKVLVKHVSAVIDASVASTAATASSSSAAASSRPVSALCRPVVLARRSLVQQPAEGLGYVYRPIGHQSSDPLFSSAGLVGGAEVVGAGDDGAGARLDSDKQQKRPKKDRKEKRERKDRG